MGRRSCSRGACAVLVIFAVERGCIVEPPLYEWIWRLFCRRDLSRQGRSSPQGVLIPASRWGKAKMGLQVAAIIVLLMSEAILWLRLVGFVLLCVAVLATVVSAVLYGKEFRRRVLTA